MIVPPPKKRLLSGNPLDQKEIVQSIFKFLSIRSIVALSRVSHSWCKYLNGMTCPIRLNFHHADEPFFDFDDGGKNILLRNISASRIQDVTKATDCIIYDAGASLDIAASLFCNVKELAFDEEIDSAVEGFYLALASQTEYLAMDSEAFYDAFIGKFLLQGDFSNVQMIDFGWIDEDVLDLDYKALLPRLEIVMINSSEDEFPIGLRHIETICVRFSGYSADDFLLLNPEDMPNLKNVILLMYDENLMLEEKKTEISTQLELFDYSVKLRLVVGEVKIAEIMRLGKAF